MNNWSNKIQSVLYPYTCFICNQAGDKQIDLCNACFEDLTPISICCDVCGIKMNTQQSHTCGKCLKKTPYFDKIRTLYEYEDASKKLVQSLKFNAKYSCARIIGQLMGDHFKQHPLTVDALIAVPLHKKRLRERGFNQADLIIRHLQHQLTIPVHHHLCTRAINTVSQTTLKAEQRRKNLKNAFRCKPLEQINSIAVIDDVVTTGSTANEIAKTLKKAGAKRVEIWAFARA